MRGSRLNNLPTAKFNSLVCVVRDVLVETLISPAGNNGKYVNMYYVNDVKCEGADGGLAVGILYLPGGMVNFTISGYQGQDGRMAFLSSEARSADYKGSLAVKDLEDRTCRFTVQNL
ncbi:hypothetical protein DFH09DRAFT_1269420 [Mycena vulgaris]|nr:hypothetical protein DFH09DRAFT_1269420 [Mycena vulgaris]